MRGQMQKETEEELDSEHQSISILNQDLKILELEFQIEEADLESPEEFSETIDANKSFCWGCCWCPVNSKIKLEKASVHSKDIKELFHVKNKEDFIIKREKVVERYEKMHNYGYNRCNDLSRGFQ